ncbi:MAG: hypothetical protein ACOYN0_07130, partial [Phycisphaerales bacterium]
MNRTPQTTIESRAQGSPDHALDARGLVLPGQGSLPLRVLRRLPPRLQIAALEAALGHALPAERPFLAAALVELAIASPFGAPGVPVPFLARIKRFLGVSDRSTPAPREAAQALVSRWLVLPEEVRRVVATLPASVRAQAVAAAAASADHDARQSAAAFIRADPLPQTFAYLAPMLADQIGSVSREAEISLLSVAAACVQDPLDANWLADLETAAAKGAAGFGTHKRLGAVISALLLSDRRRLRDATSPVRAWIEGEASLATGVTRGALRAGVAGEFRLRAWELLADVRWAPACRIRLARAESFADHELVLSDWHLAMSPRRAREAEPLASGESGRLLPRPSAFARLSPSARHGAVRLASVLGTPVSDRAELCAAALSDSDSGVRLAAADAAPIASLPDFMFDPDERVARRAMLRGSSLGEPYSRHSRITDAEIAASRTASALMRSSRATISSWANHDLARADLHARLAVAALASSGVTHLRAALGSLVETAPAAESLRAIENARRAGLAGELAPAIIRRLRDAATDTRLAATCIAALSDAPNAAAWPIIESALAAPDARVRANAVEAAAK